MVVFRQGASTGPAARRRAAARHASPGDRDSREARERAGEGQRLDLRPVHRLRPDQRRVHHLIRGCGPGSAEAPSQGRRTLLTLGQFTRSGLPLRCSVSRWGGRVGDSRAGTDAQPRRRDSHGRDHGGNAGFDRSRRRGCCERDRRSDRKQGNHGSGPARGGCSLRAPDAPLEPADGELPLRRAERHPHHRPRPDPAPVQERGRVRQGDGGFRREGSLRRHQAPGPGRRRDRGDTLGAVLRQQPLARRDDDQLQDGQEVHRALQGAARARRRRGEAERAVEEGAGADEPLDREVHEVARRHQGDGEAPRAPSSSSTSTAKRSR